jgi:hypothetical protein
LFVVFCFVGLLLLNYALLFCCCSAVGYCEPKPLYLALLGILERSGRWQLASEVWRTATKKFNTSCKVGNPTQYGHLTGC